jgi:transposase InsO family protein
MQFHSNAATNRQQRRFMRHSSQSCRVLAAQFCVSPATVHTWKQREDTSDRSCRPHTIHYALCDQEEAMVLWMRQNGELSLDDLLDAVEPLLPHLRRSSLHRLLVRHGCNRLPKKEQQATGQPGTFKEYGPGFLHIDCFYLPKLDGQKYYCFVAIDRATRLVFLWVYENKDKEAATDFLRRCLAFYPFKVQNILTDNGREFTLNGFKNRWGTKTKTVHPFAQLCQDNDIEHRQTRPYTPKTNGMVERANGLIKQGTTKQNTYQNAQQMKDDLQRWFVCYNFFRKNRRIGRITPYQAVCQWHNKQPELFLKEPTELLAYRSESAGT